jgi:arylsulfatase A-like enzyme
VLRHPETHLNRDALFFHYPHYYETTTPVSAVRAGDWKLLEYYEDHHVELYNLRRDLGEQSNLASQMGEKANKLRARLHDWLDSVQAQMPHGH